MIVISMLFHCLESENAARCICHTRCRHCCVTCHTTCYSSIAWFQCKKGLKITVTCGELKHYSPAQFCCLHHWLLTSNSATVCCIFPCRHWISILFGFSDCSWHLWPQFIFRIHIITVLQESTVNTWKIETLWICLTCISIDPAPRKKKFNRWYSVHIRHLV